MRFTDDVGKDRKAAQALVNCLVAAWTPIYERLGIPVRPVTVITGLDKKPHAL